MNSRSGYECADSATPFDDSFAFERGERVPRGHQADFVKLCEVTFGSDRIAGAQLAGINAFANG